MNEECTEGYLAGLYSGDNVDPAAVGTWTEYVQLTDITPPETEDSKIDATTLKSGKTKKYKGGRREPGEITAVGQFTSAQHARLLADRGVSKSFRVLFADDNDNNTHEGGLMCSGFVSKVGTPIDGENLVTITFTIAVSGDVTKINPTS